MASLTPDTSAFNFTNAAPSESTPTSILESLNLSPQQLAYFRELHNSVAQIHEALQNMPTPVSTPTTSSFPTNDPTKIPAPKTKNPDVFYGVRSKLRSFLSQITLYIELHPHEFPTEHSKVLYAASFLKGPAFEWFEPHLRTMRSANMSRSALLDDFTLFCQALQNTYGDIDTRANAERTLGRLRQTGAAAEYASRFQQTASFLNWNDDALQWAFYKGLKDRIKDELAKEDRPATLNELIEKAVRIDNRLYERYRESSRTTWNKTSQWTKPEPMDLSSTSFKPKQDQNKHSSNERTQRSENRIICYRCGKPGHKVSLCRSASLKPRSDAQSHYLSSRPPLQPSINKNSKSTYPSKDKVNISFATTIPDEGKNSSAQTNQ